MAPSEKTALVTGATDGLEFRARGMPVYGVDGGWAVSPDDAYQMLRGLRTLAVRMEQLATAGSSFMTGSRVPRYHIHPTAT